MPDFVYYLLTAAFSIAVFFLGQWVVRKTRRVKTCAAIALALLFAKAVLHHKPAWEAALFPWVNYVYFQSYWLYPIALFFFGIAVPQLPVRWNRFAITFLAFCVFLLSLWNERWMLFPPDDSSANRAAANHQCRQATGHSCAAAACVSLLSRWCVDVTEGEMVRLCRTREKGTHLFNIYRGLVLKSQGRPWRVRILDLTVDELQALGKPAVIGGEGHAVAVSFEGDRVTINDPLREEPISTTLEGLGMSRYFTGSAVLILDNGD